MLHLALTVLLAAPALKDKPKGDGNIVGEWVVESVQSTGKQRPPAKGGETRYHFKEDGSLIVTRGERIIGGEDRGYNFDAKKSPAEIDFIADTAEQESSRQPGIYKIEGNKLTLVLSRREGERPKGFEVSRDAPGTLYVMRRVRAKD